MGLISLENHITKERAELRKVLKDKVRNDDECPPCWEYNNTRVRGEAKSVDESNTRFRITLACNRCGNGWYYYILKDGLKKKQMMKIKNSVKPKQKKKIVKKSLDKRRRQSKKSKRVSKSKK